MKTTYILLFIALLGFLCQSCSDYLDAKPSRSLVVPSSLDDYQSLMDAEQRGMNYYPIIGAISSDDNVFGNALLERLSFSLRAVYLWEKETYMPDEGDANWSFPYQKIFYANVVLDGLRDYQSENAGEAQRMTELEASAKFYRAMGHFEVLMHFAEPFDPASSGQMGIPVRLTSDVNIKVGRSSMREGFDEIIRDLAHGAQHLPEMPTIPTRPSQWAANAMLGRVFLAIHDYESAFEFSKRALDMKNDLMDYKSLESGLPYSFEIFNPEVIFYQRQLSSNFTTNAENFVNPELVELYDSTDLRPLFFFRVSGIEDRLNFRGNYTGDFYHFGGIATDEVVLNLAESASRLGDEAAALQALNYLLENRMKSGFEGIKDLSGQDLLRKIVLERRKELPYRGIRWLDLKRHNLYPELAVTLSRNFNEGTNSLEPEDSRYTFLIPPAELNLNPMPQNER